MSEKNTGRKMLTLEERVAKAKAEAAELEKKLQAKADKQRDELLERRKNLVTQVEARGSKVAEIDAELTRLGGVRFVESDGYFDEVVVSEDGVDSIETVTEDSSSDDATVTDISARTGS